MDLQHPVTMLFAEVCDGGAAGFEDPQAQEAEQKPTTTDRPADTSRLGREEETVVGVHDEPGG
jgi:hypothetical protein